MADEIAQTEHTETVLQPLAPDPAPEPPNAAERLRAFEDEHLGKDAVRIDGRVERGSGSPFQKLSDERKGQYAALERLIAAEQKVSDARAALAAAESEHAAALTAAEPTNAVSAE